MKTVEMNKWYLEKYSSLKCLVLLLLFIGLSNSQIWSQENEAIKSRISLNVIQKGQDSVNITALVRARINKRYRGLPELEVIFTNTLEDSVDTELGKLLTNADGLAEITFAKEALVKDTSDTFTIVAMFAGTKDYKKSESDIEFVDANINMVAVEEDSLKFIQVHVQSRGKPVQDEDLALYVEGLFSSLLIAEETTDEDGMASFEFPSDLPGDVNGNLHIISSLIDHDDFGTLEAETTEAWGNSQAEVISKLPRALWSPYPPLWLLLAFLGILTYIWIHYFGIIYNLYKMKKELKQKD